MSDLLRNLALPVLAVLLGGGCTVSRSLQLAQPVGRGNTDVSFEAGAGTIAGPDGWLVSPNADLALRHGLGDDTDFTFRSGSSGIEGGLKKSFAFDALPKFWFAGDARLGARGLVQGVPMTHATVGGVAQWSPSNRLHLLLAPSVTVVSLPGSAYSLPWAGLEDTGRGDDFLLSQNTNLYLLPMTSIGAGWDVHPAMRVIGEVAVPVHPAVFRDMSSGLPVTGSIALQWRTRGPAVGLR